MPPPRLGDRSPEPARGGRGRAPLKLGIAQLDARVGDLRGNRSRILAAVDAARDQEAELVVLPELIVTGYPPRDLLLDDAFVEAALASTEELARETRSGPPVLLGSIARAPLRTPGHPGLWNAAVLLEGGAVRATVAKRLLPAYDVFHEPRWFVPGDSSTPLEVAGKKLGVLVCEDMWDEGYPVHPSAELRAAGAEQLVCLSASPYRLGVLEKRRRHAGRHGLPIVYVNAVGANDELIHDGGSFALDASGRLAAELPRWDEVVRVIDTGALAPIEAVPEDEPADLFRALVTGVRAFVQKNGLRRAFFGISGGIDSALVACIAKEAIGAANVTAIAIPSRWNDPRSASTSRDLARALGIHYEEVSLEKLHSAAQATLGDVLAGDEGQLPDENVQARLRMVVLMAFVNRRGGVLLNTSNKTELALGYGTLYGDMAGTLGVLADLTKPQVYALARHYDRGRGLIPSFIIDRAPSAELRAGQVDPFDYPVVSPIVEALIQGTPPPEGTPADELERWRRTIKANEHKRRQYGIGLKVSEKAFGSGRLIPVTKL